MPTHLDATWPARLLVLERVVTISELDRMSICELADWIDALGFWRSVKGN